MIVSLTYEPGRAAFAGRGATFQELAALGRRARRAAGAGRALRRARRCTTSSGGCSRRSPPADPAPPRPRRRDAAGGRRRAGRARARRRARRAAAARGHAGRRRSPSSCATADAARARGRSPTRACRSRSTSPSSRATPRSAAASSALLRCALRDGVRRRPARLAAHAGHAAPARARRPPRAGRARRRGVDRDAPRGRAGRPRIPSSRSRELDRVAALAREPERLYEYLQREVDRLALAPWRGQARVLAGPEALDARVARALRGAFAELGALGRADRSLVPDARELIALVEALEVRPARAGAGTVAIAGPGACAPGACARCSPAASGGLVPARRARPSRSWATTSGGRINAAGGPAAAPARGRPRRRALPVLRGRLAARPSSSS